MKTFWKILLCTLFYTLIVTYGGIWHSSTPAIVPELDHIIFSGRLPIYDYDLAFEQLQPESISQSNSALQNEGALVHHSIANADSEFTMVKVMSGEFFGR